MRDNRNRKCLLAREDGKGFQSELKVVAVGSEEECYSTLYNVRTDDPYDSRRKGRRRRRGGNVSEGGGIVVTSEMGDIECMSSILFTHAHTHTEKTKI